MLIDFETRYDVRVPADLLDFYKVCNGLKVPGNCSFSLDGLSLQPCIKKESDILVVDEEEEEYEEDEEDEEVELQKRDKLFRIASWDLGGCYSYYFYMSLDTHAADYGNIFMFDGFNNPDELSERYFRLAYLLENIIESMRSYGFGDSAEAARSLFENNNWSGEFFDRW